MNSSATTNAILLVGVGFLGFIASSTTGTPIFGLAGVVAFVLAAATGIGALAGAVREGFNAHHEPPTAKRAKRTSAADPYANVPY